MMTDPIKLNAVLYDVRTKRDGSARVTFDTGVDSLAGILELIELNASGDISVAIALVPYSNQIKDKVLPDGEIVIDEPT